MLAEILFKDSNPEKKQIRKMNLIAKDYVHYLKGETKAASSDGSPESEFTKTDGPTDMPKFSQILHSLKEDLRCATTIFLEEFTNYGGLECLLDVLRQNQSRLSNSPSSLKGRQQQSVIKAATVEQYDCLLCLKYAMKYEKAVVKLTETTRGLSSISSCIMSSCVKSRILALELLCRVLEVCGAQGHNLILEALTTNRVLYGEPVRFKFLVSMLHGNIAGQAAFQCTGLKFLNHLLKTTSKPAERIRLQCELEEAGFNIGELEMNLRIKNIPLSDSIWVEVRTWKKQYLDMENVTGDKQNLMSENEKLQKEVQVLRQALQKLEEDKINLMQIEMELKEKCEDLNEEVTTLKTEIVHTKTTSNILVKTSPKTATYRKFSEGDDEVYNSEDHEQLETEEILIDVPTIRPPIEFRTDSCYEFGSINSLEVKSKTPSIRNMENNKLFNSSPMITTVDSSNSGPKPALSPNNSDKESADSALSESESDSGIHWSYPEIPQATSVSRNSRTKERHTESENPTSYFFHARSGVNNKLQRSRSEDRRDSTDKCLNKFCEGEARIIESSNFFMRRPQKDHVLRYSSKPFNESSRLSSYKSTGDIVTPSYQLPVAYRSNFLTRGHSNCDLYSGVSEKNNFTPPIPPPDYAQGYGVPNSGGTISALVHREITKAVRQISGWI